MSDVNTVRERLQRILSSEQAESDVRSYFAAPSTGYATYTGRLFERFGGGGDRPGAANCITADDLLAVETLSVQVPPDLAYALLYGAPGDELSQLLGEIPSNVSLGAPEAGDHIALGAPAHKAWTLLEQQPGMGWVTAGKLMARKRPALVPVYDRVVRCVLGAPKRVWHTLDEALADPGVQSSLKGLYEHAPGHVTPLRVLDVAIWMRHHGDHARGDCTAAASA